jgi:hypothetical protein
MATISHLNRGNEFLGRMTSDRINKFLEVLSTGNDGALERLVIIGETAVVVGDTIHNLLQGIMRKGYFAKLEVGSIAKSRQKVGLQESVNEFEKKHRISQKYFRIIVGWVVFHGFC